MPGQQIRTVEKKSFITFGGKWVDFRSRRTSTNCRRPTSIDCLYDLYFARGPGAQAQPETNFKEMLFARFGRSIAEKFLIPYNEKLYATDLGARVLVVQISRIKSVVRTSE